MFLKRYQQVEKPVYESKEVDVWQCPNCIGWMQKEFTVSENPSCPFCSSEMVGGMKAINVIVS